MVAGQRNSARVGVALDAAFARLDREATRVFGAADQRASKLRWPSPPDIALTAALVAVDEQARRDHKHGKRGVAFFDRLASLLAPFTVSGMKAILKRVVDNVHQTTGGRQRAASPADLQASGLAVPLPSVAAPAARSQSSTSQAPAPVAAPARLASGGRRTAITAIKSRYFDMDPSPSLGEPQPGYVVFDTEDFQRNE